MKVVILCGGKGTRLKEFTEEIPKPLVEIGGKPILFHIMKIYSYYGFNDFILCLGYKGDLIKQYFLNYHTLRNDDSSLKLKSKELFYHSNEDVDDWNITFANTGLETATGGRIKLIEKYINEDNFFCTYGDGVANINLKELLDYHGEKKKIATITCVNQPNPFGVIDIDGDNIVTQAREKPMLNHWINGGFFLFHKEIFNYIKNLNEMLEKEPFNRLVEKKQMCAYKLNKFWKCMDTYKDTQILNELWVNNKAEWKIW